MSERSRASGRSGSHCAERKGYRHLDKMYRALTFFFLFVSRQKGKEESLLHI
jgi:hypothetical protein